MQRASRGPSDFRPWRLHSTDRQEARRRELFALAAPVFRRYGYRGSTIKALAHACGLSPASLYHYFGSKEEMATYRLRRPRMDWDSTWVDPTTDPLVQLAQLVDLSLSELPNYLLAIRLADEIAGIASHDGAHARTFREGEAVFARLVAASAPGMSRAEATRIARDALSAMVGSAVLGLDPEPDAAVRERVVSVLDFLSSGIRDALLSRRTRSNDPEAVALVLDSLRTMDRRALANAMVSISLQRPDLTGRLSSIRCSTMFVTGSAAVVPDTAYLIPLEAPEATIQSVLDVWAR